MKRFAVLSALLLFSSMAHAQDATSVAIKRDVSPANREDARMKALEPRSERNTTPTTFETFVQEVFSPAYNGQAASA